MKLRKGNTKYAKDKEEMKNETLFVHNDTIIYKNLEKIDQNTHSWH